MLEHWGGYKWLCTRARKLNHLYGWIFMILQIHHTFIHVHTDLHASTESMYFTYQGFKTVCHCMAEVWFPAKVRSMSIKHKPVQFQLLETSTQHVKKTAKTVDHLYYKNITYLRSQSLYKYLGLGTVLLFLVLLLQSNCIEGKLKSSDYITCLQTYSWVTQVAC